MKMSKKDMIIIVCIVIILVIAIVGVIFLKKGMGNGEKDSKISIAGNISKKDQVKIVKSEAKEIKLTDYNNGLFSMKLPEGWKIDTIGDSIHYTIKAYNPEDPSYQMFFNMKTEGYNKSQAAKNFQQRYYPDSMFAKTAVLEDKTTEGFYKIFNEQGALNNTASFTFPTINNFTVIEKLGTAAIGGDILRASFKNENEKDTEGLFTAYVYDPGPYYVNENVFSGNKIDIYYLSVYNAIFVTAPKDEFINWEETLNTMVSSLEFSDSFISQFNSQQDAVMKSFQNVRSIGNQISDGIMSSWESRNAAYDRMSQKQSDATLGYERVYDTETGDIYKAYNGFTDDYDGERYKSITDDMYSKSIEGYKKK